MKHGMRRFAIILPALLIVSALPAHAAAQTLPTQLPDLSKTETVGNTLELVALVSVLSLAPAILLMVTSFTRIIIVLSLLRQGIGAQQLPPNQVLVGLSLFMTIVVM